MKNNFATFIEQEVIKYSIPNNRNLALFISFLSLIKIINEEGDKKLPEIPEDWKSEIIAQYPITKEQNKILNFTWDLKNDNLNIDEIINFIQMISYDEDQFNLMEITWTKYWEDNILSEKNFELIKYIAKKLHFSIELESLISRKKDSFEENFISFLKKEFEKKGLIFKDDSILTTTNLILLQIISSADGNTCWMELDKMIKILKKDFNKSEKEIDNLLTISQKGSIKYNTNEIGLFINKNFELKEKIKIINRLWLAAWANKELHANEIKEIETLSKTFNLNENTFKKIKDNAKKLYGTI